MLSGRITASYRPCGELRFRTQLFASGEREKVLRAQDEPTLSKAPKSKNYPDKPKSGSGFGCAPAQTIFTVYAKRFVQDAASVIESEYGKRVVFVTLTLPGSTEQSLEALCNQSAYVVQRMCQWFRDTAPGADWVYVWERQKRGALHLHVALACLNIECLRTIEAEIKEEWCYLMQKVGERSGVDMFARASGGTWATDWSEVRANAKPIRKSIAA